jgi:outer membrane protein TolC
MKHLLRPGAQKALAQKSLAQKALALMCATGMFASTTFAQTPPVAAVPNGPQTNQVSSPTPVAPVRPFSIELPKSRNPISAYLPSTVPEPDLTNSPRIDQLIRGGKLYLSIRNAIELALENNLDLAIARYNMPIADTDILRTQAGGSVRGVNTGVVQTTQSGGASGGAGAGAGGTSGGAGGAGSGAGGLVQSTLGQGSQVSSFDPSIVATANLEHTAEPVYNLQEYGVPNLKFNTINLNGGFAQAFATGTSTQFQWTNQRQTINSPYYALTPALNVYWQFTVTQQLLNGFGLGPNLRYLRIAKNDKKISDLAFKDQVITTVTLIKDLYWDLVNTYQDEQVKTRSRDFAQKTLEDTKKQFDLQAVPAIDVMRAEAEVANREQELTVAKTNLQLEESLMKNAVTKSLDDPVLEEMPVVPTDTTEVLGPQTFPAVEDLINEALKNSPTLAETAINLQNQVISRKALRNNLLPSLTAVGFYGGSGLAGQPNPNYDLGPNPVVVPPGLNGALGNAYNNTSPTYYAGLNLSIPLRNRVARADQFRAELEYRQNELYAQQTKKQIRLNVRNAEYTVEQSVARVQAATKARDLAQKTFEIDTQEQQLGAGSIYQTLTAQRDLSVAQSSLVTAQTAYEKAKVDLDRAVGTTLDHVGISIDEAKTGVVPQSGP